ncbi:alternate-type signal peptide domain-containing protein [Nocardioides dongxiaopingii]|uniref:alternate-type signal peptide domain-containing protein n=1 Tax=Nocardioides TaxID=1839 RepID=UPI0010C76EF6|nr:MULTISPECIES: alternate-type signal peptide domain-containing protein [Nocardioides]QCW50972.1 alternate-type signal peptide domain-containing protein [Nocardioides sp. S-1144]
MNKSTKGAIGAAAAAVLLLGGAGTLAFWSDSATVNGGSVNAGFLTLDDGVCDADWVYADGGNAGAPVVNFVPGDAITKDCEFVIGAEGDNLEASPTIPDTIVITPAPAAPSFTATVDATYALPGGPLAADDTITEENDGDTLTASIVVTIPFGNATTINANDTQNITASLANLTVALTQDLGADNPNP